MARELVLLGAGASRAAGIPVSNEMCKSLLGKLEREFVPHGCYRALSFVIGGLAFHKAAYGGSPYDGLNVEDAFNAVETLSRRDYIEIAPFVAQWHTAIESIEKPSESTKRQKVETFYDAMRPYLKTSKTFWAQGNPDGDLIKSNLLEAVSYVAGNPERSEIFVQTLGEMTRGLVDITWLPPTAKAKVNYLSPLVRYCFNNQIAIATLNYDNCIELACSNSKIPVATGIDSWNSFQNLSFGDPDKAQFLLKLHGSIDWEKVATPSTPEHPYPQYAVQKKEWLPGVADRYFDPAVIFGHRNKLTVQGPFMTLLTFFATKLQEADVLTVIGYSFSDDHINHFIGQWLNGNKGRKIRLIIGPNFDILESPFGSTVTNGEFLLKRIDNTKQYANEESMKELFGP